MPSSVSVCWVHLEKLWVEAVRATGAPVNDRCVRMCNFIKSTSEDIYFLLKNVYSSLKQVINSIMSSGWASFDWARRKGDYSPLDIADNWDDMLVLLVFHD